MFQNADIVAILCDNNLPVYATEGSSGADIKAVVGPDFYIEPGTCSLVPTKIKVAIPQGFEMQVRSRSGLALNHQVVVLNSPGTIDSDYRGEIGVILMNHGKKPFLVESGMRIAQLVLAPVSRGIFTLTNSFRDLETSRGEAGFGSTGFD